MKCRRCRREVPDDATKCDYCELENPTAAPVSPEPQHAERSKRVYMMAALGGLIVVGAGLGAWYSKRNAPSAPACDAASITGGVAELMHDNSVHELTPAEAERFPVAAFAKLTGIESATGNGPAQQRACSAVVQLALDERALAAVERLAAGGATRSATMDMLTTSWHASERRLEVKVKYNVAPLPSGGDAPWDLQLDEATVAGVRDLVRLIVKASSEQ